MRPVLHRPAILGPDGERLTTACGRRGAIGRVEASLLPLSMECPACAVAWDEAEQEGRVVVRRVVNARRSWRGAGAFVVDPGDGVCLAPRSGHLLVVQRVPRHAGGTG